MAADTRLERARDRTFEVAEIPEADYGAVETCGSLLKLNQVFGKALPKRLDVYD